VSSVEEPRVAPPPDGSGPPDGSRPLAAARRSRDATRPPNAGTAPPDAGVLVHDLGRRPYEETLAFQRELAEARKRDTELPDLLLFVEHEPVITLGRGARREHILVSDRRLAELGVRLAEVERGGDVTYHGPGQLVGYPILRLDRHRRDLHWYLRRLEETLLGALAGWDLTGVRVDGFTGVWVADREARSATAPRERDGFDTAAGPDVPRLVAAGHLRKIASIGVHASRWVTTHGFALNLTDEPLRHFAEIVPCGIDGVRMTTLESEGVEVTWDEAVATVAAGFEAAFDVRLSRGPRGTVTPEASG